MLFYGELHNKYTIKKSNTLQVQTPFLILSWIRSFLCKRVSQFTFNQSGAMTVEASLVIPIFVFVITGLLNFGNLYLVEEEIGRGLTETARYFAKHTDDGVNTLLLDRVFNHYVDQDLMSKAGLNKSISFQGSYLDSDSDELYLYSSYTLELKIPMIANFKKKSKQQIRQKVFVGYDYRKHSELTDAFVFLAENNSVYHTNRQCTHLTLSIQSVTNIKDYLAGNTRYTPCEQCSKYLKEDVSVLYITDDGQRYHMSLTCSGLKRTVTRVRKSQTGGVGLCQRCGN